jgi:hypothetical protein
MHPYAKGLAAWLAILVGAIANGALRETVLVPAWGPVPAQLASGVLLALFVLFAAWITVHWIGGMRSAVSGSC